MLVFVLRLYCYFWLCGFFYSYSTKTNWKRITIAMIPHFVYIVQNVVPTFWFRLEWQWQRWSRLTTKVCSTSEVKSFFEVMYSWSIVDFPYMVLRIQYLALSCSDVQSNATIFSDCLLLLWQNSAWCDLWICTKYIMRFGRRFAQNLMQCQLVLSKTVLKSLYRSWQNSVQVFGQCLAVPVIDWLRSNFDD